MRILNVIMCLNPIDGGGSVERVYQLSRYLALIGEDCTILTTKQGWDEEYIRKLGNVKVVALPYISSRFKIPIGIFGWLKRNIHNYDVVHLAMNWTVITACVYPFLRYYKRPYVYSAMGWLRIEGRCKLLKYIYRILFTKPMIRQANACIAITKREVGEYENLGVSREKISLIPNGVTIEPFLNFRDDDIFRTRYHIDSRPIILFIGRFNRIKGPDLLIEAFSKVSDTFSNYQLVIAGNDYGFLVELKRIAQLCRVDKKVTFLGPIFDKEKISAYRCADLVVIPSRFDTMTIIALEAALSGVPVLLTKQCDFNELQEEGAGLAVEASSEGLAEGLRTLLSKQKELKEMGRAGKEYVLKKYDWNYICKQFNEVFQKCILFKEEPIRRIVISAINVTEAGPLSILKECLNYLSAELAKAYEIVALVHDKALFDYKNIRFYSFPVAKRSWLIRLFYEYIYFYKFSGKIKPHLWFSLHDMTPNVKSGIQAVYCQNLTPFYSLSLKDVYLGGYKFTLFNLLYRYLYVINIKKNDFVVVQQESVRNKFRQFAKGCRILVAYPNMTLQPSGNLTSENGNIFFYPAFPRVFKNFEVICNATKILLKQGIDNFEVVFTLDGHENRYSKYIYNSVKSIKNIKFVGILPREKVFEFYNKANCVIFPSKLETWGIPIDEAKLFSKPILLADLEYVRETVGEYEKVKFFNPDDPLELADAMKGMINRTIVFDKTQAPVVPDHFARNWRELFDILLSEKNKISKNKFSRVR